MAVNDDLADDAIRRAALLERRINGIWKELLPILRRTERDLIAKIEAGVGPRGGTFQSQRAQALLIQVRKIIEGGAAEFKKQLIERGLETAEIEASAAVRSLERIVPLSVEWVRPSTQLLATLALTRPFTEQGAILDSFIDGWSSDLVNRVQGQIRIGLVEGEGVEQIRRRIEADVLEGGAATLKKARIKARAIVRTFANHTMTQAREAVYQANSDVIFKEQWVATLDHRTCPICGALDNKTFDLGKGPRPPIHANCRCVRVPVTRGKEALIRKGIIKEGTRAARDADGLTGEVPASQAFPEWLKNQPRKTRVDVLGKSRSDLFDKGVKFDKFVNDENEILTLDELSRAL